MTRALGANPMPQRPCMTKDQLTILLEAVTDTVRARAYCAPTHTSGVLNAEDIARKSRKRAFEALTYEGKE